RACPGTGSAPGPPAPVQGRGGDQSHGDASVLFEGDQGAPFRFAGQEAGRAVDGIDDPPTAAGAAYAELLPQDGVAGPLAQDLSAQGELDLLVSGADGTPVALGVPGGVPGGEVAQRDCVGGIRQTVREGQIAVDGVHAATGASRSTSIPRSVPSAST